MAETIQTVSIARETHERYLRYAVSVITSRALPDVRDGLKPVQRRILYTMFNDLRLAFEGRPAKCARIVGDVMGKYHPHGDSAIYDALVRLAQPWVMRVPLVHGQGNFGSVDGDAPAAYRYTEAKLAAASDSLLKELRQDTVEMRPTYNNETQEPVVLPAEFPNLLVNGASGIAVGMATNIPPHNLGEVIKACIHLIDDPEATTAELMNRVKGPDFPLGGKIVTDRTTLRKIYEEGEGSIKIQAEWKVENDDPKKPQIVIDSIPYGTDKQKIENDIGTIIENKRLPGLTGLTNETNQKDGLRITLDIKAGTDPELIMAYLYKHTDLQANFAYNMTCLVPQEDGSLRPSRLGLKAILQEFLKFRLATVRKRFEYELNVLKRRIHILEGFQIVFNALDKAIKIIRESSGKSDAATKLIAQLKLDQEQATAVLDAQLYKIAQLEIQKILDELAEKLKEAKRIETILGSEKKLWGVIKEELSTLGETLGTRRQTRMASDEDVLEFKEEAYIVRENTNVILTRDGWIKRVGRLASATGTRVREGDEVIAVVPTSTLDNIVFFADDGTAYTMRANEIPAGGGYGEPIAKFFKLADQVKIVGIETTDPRFTPADSAAEGETPPAPYLFAVTSGGFVVRTPLNPFRAISTKAGRRYIRLSEGEKVVFAKVIRHEKDAFLVTAKGYVTHFQLAQVSILAGAGKGVVGIKLKGDDTCIGAEIFEGKHTMIVETSGGTTREISSKQIAATNRGGSGTEVVKRAGISRIVPAEIQLVDWEAIEAGQPPEPPKKPSANGKHNGTLFD